MFDAAMQLVLPTNKDRIELSEDVSDILENELTEVGSGEEKKIDAKKIIFNIFKYAILFIVPHIHVKLVLLWSSTH